MPMCDIPGAASVPLVMSQNRAAIRNGRRFPAALSAISIGLGAAGAQGPPVTPGFPNVPRTPGELLSGLNAPQQGRTAVVAYHNGVLFTVPEAPASQPGSDLQVRTWSLADPADPEELATWGTTPMPVNAHGYLHNGDYLSIGPNSPSGTPWSFRTGAGPGEVVRTNNPQLLCITSRGCLFAPFRVEQTWRIYTEVEGLATISRGTSVLGTWDHLGLTGVIGHPFLLGNLLIYAAEESRTGVATYDVSNPASPVLLDVLTSGGPGGYWPEIWGGDGKLYVVLPYRMQGNGVQIVDATDPSNLRLVADVPLSGAQAQYAQFQDEFAFVGDHKVDLRSFESVLDLHGAEVVRPSDGGLGVDTSQFALPLGNLLVTGGIGEDQGMAVWAHQAAPDLRGPSVGFHIPRAGQTSYPVGSPITLLIHETLESFTIVNGSTFLVRPLGGNPIAGQLTFSFDDVLTFTPAQPLAPNTTYEVVLPEGGIKDAAGNGMVGYSFTFSTGATVAGNTPPALTAFDAGPYPAEPGTVVTFSAAASDPQGDAVELRFDFGDGSPRTAWSAATGAQHAYAAPGHYRPTVQARDASGAISSRSRIVTVVASAAPGPRPTASASLLCDAAGRRVWGVNPDHGTVVSLDADTLDVAIESAACAGPASLARGSTGEIWVACSGEDRLRVIDPQSGAPLAEIPTGYGSSPSGIVGSAGGGVLYVAFEGAGEVRRFDALTRQQTGALVVGRGAKALALSADGARLLVTRFLSAKDHGELWDIAAATMTLTRTIRLPKLGGEIHQDGPASGRGTPNQLTAIAISPDGARAWVTALKPNVERGLLYGPDLDEDNTVRATLLEIDLATHALVRAIDLDNGDSPSALAFSPLGDYLFVTLQGDDELLVLDAFEIGTAGGLGSLVARLGTGGAPQGACVDAPTGRLVSRNFLGRSLTVFELGDLFASGSIQVPSTEVVSAGGEPLAPAVLAGKRIFYNARDPRMSAEGYLSCATCHLDGGDDGRVWDFTGRGEGLRRTVPLRGRSGTGHGNLHWSANFDEIQDFEGDIRTAFGGAGFMSDADFAATAAPLGPPKAGLSPDLDALAAYVASLGAGSIGRSPYRASDGAMTAQGAAGRAVFRSLSCATCHRGSRFTDSTVGDGTLHDVGTLRTTSGGRSGGPLPGIDTPTLAGLWSSGRYLHDGSAGTLEAVFAAAGGEVIPAEEGIPSGGARIVDQFVEINNDDTVRGRAYVSLGGPGQRITFTGVDGGGGGVGALELRFSTTNAGTVTLAVNGVPRSVALPAVGNLQPWRHTIWHAMRIEAVDLQPGGSNTLEITAGAGFPNVSVDEITVSRPEDLALAAPHRQALGLAPADRAALLAYLLQLDGQPEDNPGSELFRDGFESGGVGAWSHAVPVASERGRLSPR
jgi:DNA-binding beta-propeller fold protein YncE